MVAAKIANMEHGGWCGNQYVEFGKASNDALPNLLSQPEAADKMGVRG